MVQQLRKSITALAFFLVSGAAWAQASRSRAPDDQAGRPGPLHRRARRHALGHLAALHRFALALARAVEPEQGADPQSAPDLSRLRDPARPRARPAYDRRTGQHPAPAGHRAPALPPAPRPTAPGGTPSATRRAPPARRRRSGHRSSSARACAAKSLARQVIPSIPAGGDRAVPHAAAGRRARRPGQGADHRRHADRPRDPRRPATAPTCAASATSKEDTWYVYRRGKRAGRSGHQPDARPTRRSISARRSSRARATRRRWC